MKPDFDYILFDLDGTLTDSKEGILNCIVHALSALGLEAPDREKLMPFLGPPLTWSFKNICGLEGGLLDAAVKKYRERYSTVGLFENRPYDGIREMLTELRAAGRHLAVATSKPEAFSVRILERFELAEYFETICGSGLDGSLDTKAEVIEETLRRLGVTDRSKAVMIGDRKHDMQGAAQTGLAAIGAGWGYAEEGELEENGAEQIASDPKELAELLLGNIGQ